MLPGTPRIALYNRRMRSRLNLALVVAAGLAALVLTVVRKSPEGVLRYGLDTQDVRAAPDEPVNQRHDLSALTIFNKTLLKVKERYVDPSRIDPRSRKRTAPLNSSS